MKIECYISGTIIHKISRDELDGLRQTYFQIIRAVTTSDYFPAYRTIK